MPLQINLIASTQYGSQSPATYDTATAYMTVLRIADDPESTSIWQPLAHRCINS